MRLNSVRPMARHAQQTGQPAQNGPAGPDGSLRRRSRGPVPGRPSVSRASPASPTPPASPVLVCFPLASNDDVPSLWSQQQQRTIVVVSPRRVVRGNLTNGLPAERNVTLSRHSACPIYRLYLKSVIYVQRANSRGCLAVSPSHHLRTFLNVLSRLYFRFAQRTR